MQPIYLSIQQEETGAQIRKLGAMGFENPQAVYKWISGKSLPSLDNFLILSRLLHASIEDILVVDGDIFALKLNLWKITIVHKFEKYINGN